MRTHLNQKLETAFTGVYEDIPNDICEQFEQIEQTGCWQTFFDETNIFPDWLHNDPLAIHDYYDVRNTLYLMFRLRCLSENANVTDKDLEDVGMRFYREADDDGCSYSFPNLTFPITGKAYVRYLASLLNEEMRDAFEWPYDKIPEIVHQGMFGPNARLFEEGLYHHLIKKEDGVTFHVSHKMGYDDSMGKSNAEYARIMLDELCNLHLKDIEVATDNGMLFQRCKYGLSALWMAYCDKLSQGRVTTCQACGKPIVATGERGQKRQYCDDTCRKWAARNPGKMRDMRVL